MGKQSKFILTCACISIFILREIASQSAQQLIDKTEAYTKLGAQRASGLFEKRCQDYVDNCSNKIYNFCSKYIPVGMQEYKSEIKATSCQKNGLYMNYSTAGGRCSTSVKCDTELDKRIICSTGNLYEDAQNAADDQKLKFDQNSSIVFSYFGFVNSYFISYPYRHEAFTCSGNCVNYDPRYRPWYVGAITGAKNLILIIDYSHSMAGSKILKAREAAIQVINTLGQSDWFQVVFFGTTASTPENANNLIIASQENKNKVIELINSQPLLGATNFEEGKRNILNYEKQIKANFINFIAFNKAFSVMESTSDKEFIASTCQNIFLFMTDGKVTKGIENKDQLISLTTTKNTSIKASIFTYSFGSNADQDIVKGISCSNNGIWTKVGEDDIGNVMSSYYNFLAIGLNTQEVLWSQIYKDSALGVDMITAAYPIYYTDKSVKRLLGVFGADLLVSDLKKFNDFESTIYPQISSRARKQCAKNTQQKCDLEKFRKERCFTDTECQVSEDQGTSLCPFTISSAWEKQTGGTVQSEYVSICGNTTKKDFKCDQIRLFFGLIALMFIFINIILI